MRINKEYCVTCGGLRSYVEDNPTHPAPGPEAKRTDARPDTINVTGAAAVGSFNDTERVCGCPRTYESA